VRDRYASFVVDEYQDVNPLQRLLLGAWLGGRDDVCVVGDPRQTIYSFTGATPGYLTGFAAEFPAARVIRLVRCYRSTPQVVALANRVEPGGARSGGARSRAARSGGAGSGGAGSGGAGSGGGAPLAAQRPAGPAPRFAEYADDTAEAGAVARQAAALIAAGTPAGEIAVLVRTNAQTAGFEQALADAGVPYQVRGADQFFDRPEVRQGITLLRAAGRSAGAGEDPAGQIRPALAGLGLTPQPPAGRGAARDRWESLAALAGLAEEFLAAHPAATLADLGAGLAERAAAGQGPAAAGVTVASLHAAKGLEWTAVFLPGLTDGTLPIIHAQDDAAIAEERRLFYVGITRARERLFLSWALARSPGGRASRKPSRFLDGLRSRR
jgi:DNA helicase-2/ATP-dependent DNA helicase PcrA